MIELGKRDNGVTVFDNEKLVKIDITGRRNTDYLLYFNTQDYDQLGGPESRWYQFVIDIARKDNPELCIPFDTFYKDALDIINNDRERFEKYRNIGSNGSVLSMHPTYGNKIYYPSDDAHIHLYPTKFGIIKNQELGYGLGFEKSVRDLTKLSFLLKQYGGHFQELYPLYADCFDHIRDIATKPYDECQEAYNRVLTKRRNERNY